MISIDTTRIIGYVQRSLTISFAPRIFHMTDVHMYTVSLVISTQIWSTRCIFLFHFNIKLR
jgi:hypothetical protein